MHTTKKNLNDKSAGFSLVEIMVVLSIIALVIGLSISPYRRFKAKARQLEVKLSMVSIRAGVDTWVAEKGHYRYGSDIPFPTESAHSHTHIVVGNHFPPYQCENTMYPQKKELLSGECRNLHYNYALHANTYMYWITAFEKGYFAHTRRVFPHCKVDGGVDYWTYRSDTQALSNCWGPWGIETGSTPKECLYPPPIETCY